MKFRIQLKCAKQKENTFTLKGGLYDLLYFSYLILSRSEDCMFNCKRMVSNGFELLFYEITRRKYTIQLIYTCPFSIQTLDEVGSYDNQMWFPIITHFNHLVYFSFQTFLFFITIFRIKWTINSISTLFIR